MYSKKYAFYIIFEDPKGNLKITPIEVFINIKKHVLFSILWNLRVKVIYEERISLTKFSTTHFCVLIELTIYSITCSSSIVS